MRAIEGIRRLFLHYYDPHFYEQATRERPGVSATTSVCRDEARLATRIALLAAQEVLVPAASYIEVPDCRATLTELASLFETGKVRLIGGGGSLVGYAVEKMLQYDPEGTRYLAYAEAQENPRLAPPFRGREQSATEDIIRGWQGSDLSPFLKGIRSDPKQFERNWTAVPERLGNLAFTPEYAMRVLVSSGRANEPEQLNLGLKVADHINAMYFDSFAQEYQCGTMRNLHYLDSRQAPARDAALDFSGVRRHMAGTGVLKRVDAASADELLELVGDTDVIRAISSNVILSEGSWAAPLTTQFPTLQSAPDSDTFARVDKGADSAKDFELLIEKSFAYAFPLTLADPSSQMRVDEGRKIIDITFSNVAAKGGLMAWAHAAYGAHKVIVECKNYATDPANPEVDQLAGRMRPELGRFGVLVCRELRDVNLLLRRCKDFRRTQDILLVPLTDSDVLQLIQSVDHGRTKDAGYVDVGDPASTLASRMLEVHTSI